MAVTSTCGCVSNVSQLNHLISSMYLQYYSYRKCPAIPWSCHTHIGIMSISWVSQRGCRQYYHQDLTRSDEWLLIKVNETQKDGHRFFSFKFVWYHDNKYQNYRYGMIYWEPADCSNLWDKTALTLNVRGPSYLSLTRSISWLLMPWLLPSPGNRQPWYWLYRVCRSFFSLKDFKYLYNSNVEKWHKM